jgi:flavin reductase (DIM6/NTAB) family NADH-FMN oxidoreductase RutF
MNQAAKQSVLRLVPYGLYGITVHLDGEDHGMLANWVTQAAFEPPMIAVAVENDSKTLSMIRDARAFAVSVLDQGQRELAGKLGRSSTKTPHKLKGIKTKTGPIFKSPILNEALGWVECRLVGTLPAGDHTVVLGEIMEAGMEREGAVLTMQEAGFKYSG